MWMQTVNRSDTERAWVAVSNLTGHTLTTHWPVFKYANTKSTASVATNAGGLISDTTVAGDGGGGFIGLAYEDIPDGAETGVLQVYGYHESVLVAATGLAKTVNPGVGMCGFVPFNAATVGLTSTNVANSGVAAVIALSTIGEAQHKAAQGAAASYSDHVFIRGL